ncbi:MAG: amidohydrolase family protein [Candidatus Pacebacteria bacterium]|nr:amidohydrolase family protein [Candidatus Paceibacterota bacterium]MBP9839529.1 amidohydrolase family protein [Candidatus Paceibacterota bacterium]
MSLIKIPGLIDVHVHLREPGATQKEDFYTGSKSAVKGGFTFIIDMPNNPTPTLTLDRLNEKIELSKKAVCGIGFHFGTDGNNLEEFSKVWDNDRVFGLKVYCNHTTGNMLIEDEDKLDKIFSAWNSEKPILVHAEGKQLILALRLANKYGRRLHVCHITEKIEVDFVRIAKMSGQKVTGGVTPHHLFFNKEDTFNPKGYGIMKPPLGSKEDQEALWSGLRDGTIDLVETDHAPHTKEEKSGDNQSFGVPGLESALGLMLKAVQDKIISQEDVIKFMYENPKKIFNIKEQPDTYVEIDTEKEYIFGVDGYESKCGWSPFEGMTLFGKVENVVFNGEKLIENGTILK